MNELLNITMLNCFLIVNA